MVLSSYRLVLPSGFGEIMASKLAKVLGQSSAEGIVKSGSVSVCSREQWG